MRKLVYFGAIVSCTLAVSAGPAAAHNAGLVITGNDTVVEVGSGKGGPFVSENNPHFHAAADCDYGRLDLITGRGDQYGARFAADQGQSAVIPPPPGSCPVTP